MQTVDDLGQRHDAHPRCRELNRQRHPIQAATDLCHGTGIIVVDSEAGPGQTGTVSEQFDCFVGQRQ
jgi:hypothetical protein